MKYSDFFYFSISIGQKFLCVIFYSVTFVCTEFFPWSRSNLFSPLVSDGLVVKLRDFAYVFSSFSCFPPFLLKVNTGLLNFFSPLRVKPS